MDRVPAIVSPRWDLTWFVGPGMVAAIIATIVGLALGLGAPAPEAEPEDSGLLLWIGGILLVDVAHVWASLYRTYLDGEARRLHRRKLVLAPLLCAWFGWLVHLESPALFWRVLAYLAIFHFIQQQVGFTLIYARKAGEGPRDRKLARATIWAVTAGPVLWWHAHLPRNFVWFMPGDLFAGLPEGAGILALLVMAATAVAFTVRRIALARRGHRNPLLIGIVAVTAINWSLGIVWFNDDRIFTITNVFLHGVPYLALVWRTGGRDRVHGVVGPSGGRRAVVAAVGLFYGLVVVLAVLEEALWDRLVWHEHTELFGSGGAGELHPAVLALVVALLTVPQATHYILDRFIWRVGPSNPRLAAQLGFAARPGGSP